MTASNMIAGFDMDDTIISVASGAKFAKNATDWKWWNDKVPEAIKDLAKQGFRVVIFTNQGGITKGHAKAADIKQKIQDIQAKLNIQICALVASDDDGFRKPLLGMWRHFCEDMNNKQEIDMLKSFYCGDAAGRVKGKKKDFNDTDLKFAMNIGLPFKTPEQFFLKQDLHEDYGLSLGFNPKKLAKEGSIFKDEHTEKYVKPAKPESSYFFCLTHFKFFLVVVLIGSVGSGKSTFVGTYLKDYTRINRVQKEIIF